MREYITISRNSTEAEKGCFHVDIQLHESGGGIF